jgi:hypothetical protein
MNTLISIGNSDDKLTQADWSQFIKQTREICNLAVQVHGEWFSAPDSPWQNANWCVEFSEPTWEDEARAALRVLAAKYGQDSIAWTQGPVEFLSPAV